MKDKKAFFIAGLGYGDEGKGTIVDWITREFKKNGDVVVIRYNGGAQAAHNVVLANGKSHTFSQFGSGTLAGATTYLSEFMIINPSAMMKEADHLEKLGIIDPLSSVSIDENCLITTPYQIVSNKLREITRIHKHGTCGMGIGETIQDFEESPELSIVAKDLLNLKKIKEKLIAQRIKKLKTHINNELLFCDSNEWNLIKDESNYFIDQTLEKFSTWIKSVKIVNKKYLVKLKQNIKTLIFEGAQGVLLDQKYGFFPHVTRSNTTFENAETLIKNYRGKIIRIGISRIFQTRHGNGPLVSENKNLFNLIKNDANKYNYWQGNLRVGELDLVTLKYAINIINHTSKLDGIIFTHMDCVHKRRIPICKLYKIKDENNEKLHNGLDQKYFSIKDNQIDNINLVENTNDLTVQLKSLTGIKTNVSLPTILKIIKLPLLAESFGPAENEKNWTEEGRKKCLGK